MDWTRALDCNRDALRRVMAMLFAVAGLVPGGTIATLPRHVRGTVLRLLRPAESAARRLIVTAAQGLSVPPRAAAACPARILRGNGTRLPAFPLFDPRKRFGQGRPPHPAGPGPRLAIPGLDDPNFSAQPSTPVDARRLCQRLQALGHVLDHLPQQARRYARWRDKPGNAPRRLSPLRPGWPPGYRARPIHAVDHILKDCHALAHHALCEANATTFKTGPPPGAR